VRIALVGHFGQTFGSSHAIRQLCRVAPRFGHEVCVVPDLGWVDPVVGKEFTTSSRVTSADRVGIIFENFDFLTEAAWVALERVPRRRRFVIDPDGHANTTVAAATGSDSNHRTLTRDEWASRYERAADVILQPTLGSPERPDTRRFLFFGMERIEHERRRRDFDIGYVGNNWFKWTAVRDFLEGLRSLRQFFGRIRFAGAWWDGSTLASEVEGTYADPEYLSSMGVETRPPVPFGTVLSEMGAAVLSPVFVRPMLAAQKLVTPRMFETFAADTIPLLWCSDWYANELYGEIVRDLQIDPDTMEHVAQVKESASKYEALLADVKEQLLRAHSYECRVRELVAAVE
jgi:hypothetical protein